MPHAEEKLELLKSKVIKAFDNISKPKDVIAEHECEDCFEVRKAFSGKSWKQITPEILEENYDKIPLFSSESLHCFLPAYLIYSLEHFAEDEVCSFTAYSFMVKPDDVGKTIDWWKYRFQFFTKEQLHLVYEFMDLVVQDEEFKIFVSELERGKKLLKAHIEPGLN